MVGLGSLAEEGEITAARVLGKSDINIIWASIKPVILVLILGVLSSQFFIPGLSQNSEETRLMKQNRISLDDGYWLASDSSVSYFKSTPNSNSIQDIVIYDLNDDYKLKEIKRTLEENCWGWREATKTIADPRHTHVCSTAHPRLSKMVPASPSTLFEGFGC